MFGLGQPPPGEAGESQKTTVFVENRTKRPRSKRRDQIKTRNGAKHY